MSDLNTAPKPKKVLPTPKTPTSISEQVATKNLLMVMAGALVLVLVIGGYFIYTLSQQYIRQSNEVKAQDKSIVYFKKKQLNLAALKPAYSSLTSKGSNGKSEADLIMNALPIDPDYSGLIASLERIASDSGVTLNSISPLGATSRSPGPTKKYNALSISISYSGTYDSIYKFLENIERSARVINFTGLSITGSGDSLAVTLGMTTYSQPAAVITSTQEALK